MCTSQRIWTARPHPLKASKTKNKKKKTLLGEQADTKHSKIGQLIILPSLGSPLVHDNFGKLLSCTTQPDEAVWAGPSWTGAGPGSKQQSVQRSRTSIAVEWTIRTSGAYTLRENHLLVVFPAQFGRPAKPLSPSNLEMLFPEFLDSLRASFKKEDGEGQRHRRRLMSGKEQAQQEVQDLFLWEIGLLQRPSKKIVFLYTWVLIAHLLKPILHFPLYYTKYGRAWLQKKKEHGNCMMCSFSTKSL